MKTLLTILLILSIFNGIYAQNTTTSLVGSWDNELKSTLTISKIDPASGQIFGTYENVSTGSEKFPVTGYVNSAPKESGYDNVITVAFSVRWGNIGSITTWTGYLYEKDSKLKLQTIWNLTRPNSKYTWDHIITNSDLFIKR